MKEENMKFWNSVCKTNPKETKLVKYPFEHTAIGAQFQIKHATEQWGIMGTKWGVRDQKFTPIMFDTEEKGLLIYTAILFFPEGEIPIQADITFYAKTKSGYKVENDLSKKISTDALTKGLSRLGFNSDVFEGLFDDNSYVQRMNKEFEQPEEPKVKPKGVISKALPVIKNAKDLNHLKTLEGFINQNSWTDDELKEIDLAISARRGDFK